MFLKWYQLHVFIIIGMIPEPQSRIAIKFVIKTNAVRKIERSVPEMVFLSLSRMRFDSSVIDFLFHLWMKIAFPVIFYVPFLSRFDSFIIIYLLYYLFRCFLVVLDKGNVLGQIVDVFLVEFVPIFALEALAFPPGLFVAVVEEHEVQEGLPVRPGLVRVAPDDLLGILVGIIIRCRCLVVRCLLLFLFLLFLLFPKPAILLLGFPGDDFHPERTALFFPKRRSVTRLVLMLILLQVLLLRVLRMRRCNKNR